MKRTPSRTVFTEVKVYGSSQVHTRNRKVFFPVEIKEDQKLFNEIPVHAIARFLECVDEKGQQILDFPPHVIEEISKRFQAFMDKRYASLDEAFGGRVASQRNYIVERAKEMLVAREIIHIKEMLRQLRERARARRSSCRIRNTFDTAVKILARRQNTSEENIRRIWLISKRRRR